MNSNKMNSYTIYEAQNVNSIREGHEIEVKDLAAAKRFALRHQFFLGTVMVIEQAGSMVAYTENDKWINC